MTVLHGPLVPRGWCVAPLGDLVVRDLTGQVLQGWSPQCENHPRQSESEWAVIKTTAVQAGQFLPEENKALPIGLAPRAHLEIRDQDLLITRAGPRPRVAVVCVARNVPRRLILCDKVYAIRTDLNCLLPEFSEAFLLSPSVARTLDAMKTGTSENGMNLTQGKFLSLDCPVAPINEQRRIVAKLQTLQARSRRAQTALDEVPALLEKLRQSILAAAFRGDLTKDWRAKNPDVEPAEQLLQRIRAERRKKWEEAELAKMAAKGKSPTDDRWKEKYPEPVPGNPATLPDLPRGWCWTSVDELLAEELANGRSVQTDEAGFRVLRLTALRGGRLDLTQHKGGAWTLDEARPYLIRYGDFLVSRGNGSLALVGAGGLVDVEPPPVAFPDTLIRIRPHRHIDPSYLAHAWTSRLVRDQIERAAKTTAGIYKISQGDLSRIALPVPPLPEQQAITRLLNTGVPRLSGIVAIGDEARAELDRCDSAILAKAFRGELVPQDPTDEPADVMLARLKAPALPDASAAPSTSGKRRGRPRKA